ncbi:MAG: Ig-like domain repeat protein [Acidobacteriaceae bacterium]|nr:Ig-like domain repeat protein [Acidobacteriaceae bacterium]
MAVACLAAGLMAQAQSVQFVPTINTVAGNGTTGTWSNQTTWGDGGPGPLGEVSTGMRQVAVDAQGNIYATDTTNNVIRRVDGRTGIITTVAGGGNNDTPCSGGTVSCGDGGPATSAQLNAPRGIAVDSSGNIYIVDYNDNRIRMVSATTGFISTIAGKGSSCSSPSSNTCGDGGQATAANLSYPTAVALDGLGNLYIADTTDHKIRKVVLSTGIISTVAGTGASGSSGDNGPATSATLNAPIGLICDAAGNIYLADNGAYVIRMIQVSTGNISTIAGTGTKGTVVSTNGDGGLATSALMDNPYNLAVDPKGNLYVIDSGYSEVREILATTTGASPTFGNIIAFAGGAGAGTTLGDGGLPTAAKLNSCNGVAIDSFGNVIIGDTYNARIRRVTVVPPLNTTAVGSTSATATFGTQDQAPGVSDYITGFAMASGFTEFTPMTYAALTAENSGACVALHSAQVCQETAAFTPKYPGLRTGVLNLTDYRSNPVSLGLVGYGLAPAIAFTPGTISTVAGNGTAAFSGDGGAATSATLNRAVTSVVDAAGNIYVADTGNNVIRLISASTGNISTYVATAAGLNGPQGLAVDAAGNLYIADTGNHAIRKVTWSTGVVTSIAGTVGSSGYSGDGATATSAKLTSPAGVAFDVIGNLYIADTGNNVVRAVNVATGIISTVAGNGTVGSTGDGAAATSAALNGPAGVFYLPPPAVQVNTLKSYQEAGQLLIADTGNNTIRKVNLTTGIITTAAGTGAAGYTGDGGLATAATLRAPSSVVADAAGNLYIADAGNAVVRRIGSATGNISTVAGTGSAGYSGDSGPSTSAALTTPTGVALDSSANIYISDKGANVLRKNSVNQGILNFGNQGIFANSPTQTILVANTGNQQLSLSGLNVTGNFLQIPSGTVDCSSVTTLVTGASCSIALTFEPLSITSYTGTVVLTDNALNVSGAQQTIQLTGTGIASTAAILTAITGNNQAVAINAPLKIALQAQLTDANLKPLSGQSVIFTAPTSGAAGTFIGGASSVTVTTDSAGTATAPTFTSNNTLGVYAVTASFVSSANPAKFNLTNVQNQYVTTTTLTVTPSGSTQIYGQAITLAATISPITQSGQVLTGSILFYDGTAVAATVALSNGSATYTVVAPVVGTHTYQAVYSGDINFASSNSTSNIVAVTMSSVTIGPNTINVYYGQTSATVTVAGQFTGSGISLPTGNLSYTIGSGSPTAASITNGQAALTVPSTLAVGTYPIAVTYSGDANYFSGTNAMSLVILQPSFTLSAGATSLTVIQGSNAGTTLTVTPLGNLPGTVVLSCSGLPLYTACVFNTTAVSGNNPANTLTFNGSSSPQTLQFSVAAQEAVSSLNRRHEVIHASELQIAMAYLFPGIIFAFMVGLKGRTIAVRLRLLLLCVLALMLTGILNGCGGDHYTVAPPGFIGTTNFTVNAVSSTNNVVQTLSVTLTVQSAP